MPNRIASKTIIKNASGLLWAALLATCVYYLVHKVKDIPALEWKALEDLDAISFLFISLSIVLMPFNWSLESFKWKALAQQHFKISLSKAVRATLAGVAISSWMPNRMGEYVAKIFFLSGDERKHGVAASVVNNASQWLATCLLGVISFFLLADGFWRLLMTLSFTLAVGVIFLLHNRHETWVRDVLLAMRRVRLLKRLLPFLSLFRYPANLFIEVTLISALRTVVFSTQLYLLLLAFGFESSYFHTLPVIVLVFAIQSIIPSTALVSLGIRGVLAVYFLGDLALSDSQVLLATYTLWLLNVMIPSVVGLAVLALIRPNLGDLIPTSSRKLILSKIWLR